MESRPSASASRDDPLRAALEEFITLHDRDAHVDLPGFLVRFPAAQRQELERRCLAYLEVAGQLEATRAPRPDADADPEPIETLGEFRLLRELGRGGMGVVYLARQVSLGRLVALKVLRPHLAMTDTQVERFRREAAAVARLNHPGIVPVHAVGEQGGTHFYAMEYVRGESVATVIERLAGGAHGAGARPGRPVPGVLPRRSAAASAAEIAAQVAEALHHAHQHGVVHRDVKPQNVLIDEEDRLRLVDFGLAKDAAAGSHSLSGELHGTPYYMSPEQTLAKRVPVDLRTDVFSLGVMLYELLTLRRPFEGDTMQEVLYQITFKEPAPVRAVEPRVPRDLETICMRALEKDPERRYPTAGEMAADLRRFLRLEPIHARAAGAVTRSIKWIRRHRHGALSAGVLVLVASGLGAWRLVQSAADAAKVSGLLGAAQQEFTRGDLDGALQSLARASELAPQDPLVRAKLAAAQEALEQRRKEDALRSEKIAMTEGVRLLVDAQDQLTQNPGLALLLAVEGAGRAPGPLANKTLLLALAATRERRTFLGHQERVTSVSLSPDGRTALSASEDWTARLWDAATGRERAVLSGHRDKVHTAAFDATGRRVVTASADRTARIWDVARGQTEHVLKGHTDAVRAAAFSPDGSLVATAGMDRTVRLWDAASGKELHSMAAGAALRALAFRGDGSQLLTGDELGACVVWDLATRAAVQRTRQQRSSQATCVAFAPQPGRILRCVGSAAQILDLATGETEASFESTGFVVSAAFSPDGRYLATASWDHKARVWEVAPAQTGAASRPARPVLELRGHRAQLSSVAFAPAGDRLLTGAHDRTLRSWDIRPAMEGALEVLDQRVDTVTLSRDGAWLLAASLADGTVRRWDLATRTEQRFAVKDARLLPPAGFAPDGSGVIAPASDGSVRVLGWDGQERILAARRAPVSSIACAPDGSTLAVATRDGAVRLWSWPELRELGTLKAERVRRVSFTPDSRTLITCMRGEYFTENERVRELPKRGEEDAIGLWDVASRQLRHSLPVAPLFQTVPSPDNRCLLLLSGDGGRLVAIEDGRQLAAPLPGTTVAAFDQAGERLAAAPYAGDPGIFGARSGARLATFRMPTDAMTSAVAWRRDQHAVLTASVDGFARLWDATTGQELVTLGLPNGRPVSQAGLALEDRMVITLDVDGRVRLWPVDLRAAGEEVRPRELTTEERDRAGLLTADVKAALARVDALFDELQIRSEVERRLQADATLASSVREAALGLARVRGDQPWRLEERAWAAVSANPVDPGPASRAFQLVDAACALEPDHELFLRTRGAALYRLGRLEDAFAALSRAEELNPRLASALVFLAMASHRLGYDGKARALRERLRALEDARDLSPALLQEVERVLSGPAASRPGR